jgi:hypothetical protein
MTMKSAIVKIPVDAQRAALALFNVLVADAQELDVRHAKYGFVTNFKPSRAQLELLRATFKPINLTTLFSLTEATGDPDTLLMKQILHYIEVYGLDEPGLFKLEVEGGKSTVIRFVKAATVAQLTELVAGLINTNAPIADVAPVALLVRELKVAYDVRTLANRELRVLLFNPLTDVFETGDDAVRWLCWRATMSALLIKDPATVAAVGAFAGPTENHAAIQALLAAHTEKLAQVFNRHKRLLVPLKAAGPEARRLINRISHLSKSAHVPMETSPAKTVIARAALGQSVDLARTSLRDKFRYLNLIEYKLLGLPTDAFNIRNGKVWTALERPILDPAHLTRLKGQVLSALTDALAPLRGQGILLDEHVDYGLPISRKQALGNLPYGTTLSVARDRRISFGIYWRNEWGASDLDLSAIDDSGERIGWGRAVSYGREDVTFSGDVTDARNGACEFFTVDPSVAVRRGLMVNIFRGNETAQAEIIAGYPTMSGPHGRDAASKVAESWQDQTLLREKVDLKSKQTLLGFIRGDRFVLYSGRLGSSRVSRGKQPVVDRGLADLWTVSRLLTETGVSFDTTPQAGVSYTHDLRYASFSLDKLERIFEFGKESS